MLMVPTICYRPQHHRCYKNKSQRYWQVLAESCQHSERKYHEDLYFLQLGFHCKKPIKVIRNSEIQPKAIREQQTTDQAESDTNKQPTN